MRSTTRRLTKGSNATASVKTANVGKVCIIWKKGKGFRGCTERRDGEVGGLTLSVGVSSSGYKDCRAEILVRPSCC